MKRLAAFTTRAVLLGALLSVGTVSHAQNVLNMYLVPVSDLNGSYNSGDIIQFAALVDIPDNNLKPTSITVGPAVAYDRNVFGINSITATADTSAYPPKPSVKLWNLGPLFAYSHTDIGLDGTSASALPTFQPGLSHSPQYIQPGNALTSIPGGTYTICTFSFPILATTPPGQTTIYLPTAYNFGGSTSATDKIYTVDHNGSNKAVLAFPNTGGKFSKLTYTIGNANVTTATFQITFPGLVSTAPAQSVTVIFHPTDNSGDITRTGAASQMNRFTASVPPNTYDIYVKSPQYLGVALRGSVIGASAVTYSVTLPPGDANNDNTVDSGDFGYLVNAYGTTRSSGSYNAQADFNSDGTVDILDFNLLLESYGLSGYL